MRPKKKILLCGTSELFLSQMTVILGVWGYAVKQHLFHPLSEMSQELSGEGFEGALILGNSRDYDDTPVKQLKKTNPLIKVVLFLDSRAPVETKADVIAFTDSCRVALKDALKTAMVQKRGKKTVYGRELAA